jgi:hypothetical protein
MYESLQLLLCQAIDSATRRNDFRTFLRSYANADDADRAFDEPTKLDPQLPP